MQHPRDGHEQAEVAELAFLLADPGGEEEGHAAVGVGQADAEPAAGKRRWREESS